jgi:hypothetical protein
MRFVYLLLVAAGCGGTPSGTGDGGGDGSAGGICGDGTCSGELCGSCPADCATRDPVCGNGACDPGEDSASCLADCGPTPWTWASDEQQLFDQVNALRTGGFRCPGAASVTSAPPLALQASFVPGGHEWAWEIAHQSFAVAGGGACNGRTFADRTAEWGFTAFVLDKDHATAADAFAAWKASATLCPILMNAQRTQGAAAIALDAAMGYLVVMK